MIASYRRLFESDYYFPASMPFFRIPESLDGLAQRVTLVDDRGYLSTRHSSPTTGQIRFVDFRDEKDHLLSHER